MKLPVVLAGLAGLAFAVWLLAEHGITDIAGGVAAVGWGLAAVVALQALRLACDAAGWRALFPEPPPFRALWWMRWVSETVNNLLPVAQVGGEVARGRLVSRPALVPVPRVPVTTAAATVIADMTTGLVATMAFTLTGFVLLVVHLGGGGSLADGLVPALAVLAAMIVGLALAQRLNLAGRIAQRLGRHLGPGIHEGMVQGAAAFEAALTALYRDRRAVAASVLWRLTAWFAGVPQVWLALWLMGHPVSWLEAVMLESLVAAARTVAFAVPAGVGVQEGAYLLLGSVIGLPPDVALALAVVRRVRELAAGLPGLAVWWLAELKVRRGEAA